MIDEKERTKIISCAGLVAGVNDALSREFFSVSVETHEILGEVVLELLSLVDANETAVDFAKAANEMVLRRKR